ncbi:MAG: hypothetical protein OXC14_20785 [Rhodospirillaceae bacterium]|nr:hypothetical protein [Rhodospirillaceae bacterium]
MNNPSDKERPIDKLRNGSGSLKIITPDDDSAISEMISIDNRLLVVKDKGIYEVKLADQVDPERTNIGAPNTIQQILPHGVQDSWIGAVVLTANHLFQSPYLSSDINGSEAFAAVLEIAEDIAGAHELVEKYCDAEDVATRSLDPKIRKDRSVIVPALGNIETRCNEFLQRSNHALQKLFRVVRMFYSDVSSGGWVGLKTKIDGESKDIDNFPQFLDETVPFLLFIRNARNCVEHRRSEQRLVTADFSVDARNVLLPPTVEIIHPRTPLPKMSVNAFFTQTFKDLVRVVELMVVFLCARHVSTIEGVPVQVVEFPHDRRRSPHVRYGYGAIIGDEIVPMS